MPTISQRELRNDNAEVVRGVERGESYVVTRRGVPVARLVPYVEGSDLRLDRPATTRLKFRDLVRVEAQESSEDILDDLRGER